MTDRLLPSEKPATPEETMKDENLIVLYENLIELIEEAAGWIRQSRGPSLYMGEEAITQSVVQAFRQRLLNALLATIPEAPVSESLIKKCEEVRRTGRLDARTENRITALERAVESKDIATTTEARHELRQRILDLLEYEVGAQ